MSTVRAALLAAVIAALAGTTGAAVWRLTDVPDVPTAPVVQLQEDGPGWDCATAGNGQCQAPGKAERR